MMEMVRVKWLGLHLNVLNESVKSNNSSLLNTEQEQLIINAMKIFLF